MVYVNEEEKGNKAPKWFYIFKSFLNSGTGVDLLRRYDFQFKKSYKPKLVCLLILRLN